MSQVGKPQLTERLLYVLQLCSPPSQFVLSVAPNPTPQAFSKGVFEGGFASWIFEVGLFEILVDLSSSGEY